MPSMPKRKNGARHPRAAITATTSTGVTAAARREPACVMPCAKPRSVGSIQRESDRVAIGNAPASPKPNRNRKVTMDAALHASAVAEVNMDHQVTVRNRKVTMDAALHASAVAEVNMDHQ